MRVLHVHSGNLYGGVETLLATLARYRHVCPPMESQFALCFEGRVSADLTAAGVPVHRLGNVRVSRPLSVWRARRTLADLLRRGRFEVVVCHSAWTQAIFGPVVHGAGLPLVFWMHGPANGRHWLERWARLTPPDLALCNSQFTAGTLPNLYPDVRHEVVYCPVAAPESRYSDGDRGAARRELNTPDGATVIIQVSRMERLKGHALHFRALAMLSDQPDWVCWQVGGTQRPDEIRYLEEITGVVTRLGIGERVCFLGQRQDVPRLLAAADIYCQPNSDPESFGITFVEALFARLPIITTSIGGAREIVDDSCGVLVPPNDPSALAAALRRLIEDQALRAHLGTIGPARAKKLCDPSAQIQQVSKVLANVASHDAFEKSC